jgi:hypothetical protein
VVSRQELAVLVAARDWRCHLGAPHRVAIGSRVTASCERFHL